MYSPKRFTVRLAPCRSVISGVPVKAMRVALGKALEEVVAEVGALRAVRLVDHEQDARPRG